MARKLTHAELAALQAELAEAAGDWDVEVLGIDGVPLAEYVPDEDGTDVEAFVARFRAGLERMQTDPEYAAYIRRLADEADLPPLVVAGPQLDAARWSPEAAARLLRAMAEEEGGGQPES